MQRRMQRLYPENYGSPRTHNLKEDQPVLSEKKIAAYGIALSLLAIAARLFTSYREVIEKAILEQKLVSYGVLSEDGGEMLIYTWKTAVKYSSIWLPIICGILSTYFTWIMVYLDSNVPGIQPPSPLSPQKYKIQSGHTFHLNYMFAILVGMLVFFYMYFRGVSIEY